MANRMKQLGLTIALSLPLVVSAFVSGPFSASASAQPGQRMVGPASPILVDTNGDGFPSAGDAGIIPQQSGTALTVTTLWSCNTQPNTQVFLADQDGGGRFLTASRTNNGRLQVMRITSAVGGAANQFSFSESDSFVHASGVGGFLDMNGDGFGDAITISGKVSATIGLLFTSDSSYVSIPLSQVAALGIRSSPCGLRIVPQIWVPLTDTDGDRFGDSVVFDLNGDGAADGQFFRSPRMRGLSVPATSNTALAVLVALLGSIGIWFIGRHRPTGLTPRPL
jgi:hypothetical protein